jgi:hypothetical protein
MPQENDPRLTPQFEDALVYAARFHALQKRKGTDIPYIAHLLARKREQSLSAAAIQNRDQIITLMKQTDATARQQQAQRMAGATLRASGCPRLGDGVLFERQSPQACGHRYDRT